MASSFAKPTGPDGAIPMAEMNTTPLIDVMLVLLIMFIITIPIQTHSVAVELPGQTQELPMEMNPIKNKVGIDADGVIRWNGAAIDRLTLRQYLAASLRRPVEPELQFQPDAAARYMAVDAVLADIKRAGVTKLGFVGNERYGQF
ncbi:biopolymer transporter ExbD [Sphingobium sp. BYY-5]|uniref:ExbD/TolR family protein n=1 Tax=Sphingobium sp. BYY-5 TaxID=2926400 RepID=UPI001FA73186|nr:biopolymer transporter ExbD [Sphingobium sp. BYY-5]MCI4591651.1 biopolymer transporter ExbD [Sphingobium sp. BYY-5]